MIFASGKTRAVLLLVSALLLGIGLGVAGSAWAREGHWMGSSGPDRKPAGYLTRLSEELDLTPVQRDSVAAVLERYGPQMDSVWAEVRPRFETVRAAMRSEIERQLTPEQQRKYEEMRRKRRGDRHGK